MARRPKGPVPVDARVATRADLPAIAETMALAFYGDPVWSWAYPDPDGRLDELRFAWGFILESALDHGWVWQAEGCGAAALWIPPGRPELRPEDEKRFEAALTDRLGDGAARVLDTFECLDAAHPQGERYFYLSLLATHPDRAGRGLGMGLLVDNLARIDAEGAPAFLESSNPANDRRYELQGFAPRGRVELGDGGPAATTMWREPR